MTLEVASRPAPFRPYLVPEYPSAPYEARLPPDVRSKIVAYCARHHRRSIQATLAVAQTLGSTYCRQHRHHGWSHEGFMVALQDALSIAKQAGHFLGEEEAETIQPPSRATRYRLYAILREAETIRVGKDGDWTRARVLFVKMDGMLEHNGGVVWHRAQEGAKRADANRRKAKSRAAQAACQGAQPPPPAPGAVSPMRLSHFGGASNRPGYGLQAPKKCELRQSHLKTRAKDGSTDAICFQDDRPTNHPDSGLSRPLSLHKKIKNLESRPSDTSRLQVGEVETAAQTSPPLDPSSLKEAVVRRDRVAQDKSRDAGSGLKIYDSEEKTKAPVPSSPAQPTIPSGLAAAPKVTVEAKTPPERLIATPGATTDQAPEPWEAFKDPAQVRAWLATAPQGVRAPPANPVPPPPPPRSLPHATIVRAQPTPPAVSLARFEAVRASGAERHDDGDMTAQWMNGGYAYYALEEITHRQKTAEAARKLLGEMAWKATVSVKPWENWLKDCTLAEAYDAYHAFIRLQKEAGGNVFTPEGMPQTPLEFVNHVTSFCGAQAAIIGVNGRALAALKMTQEQYMRTLHGGLAGFQKGKIPGGKRLAAYILGVAEAIVRVDREA